MRTAKRYRYHVELQQRHRDPETLAIRGKLAPFAASEHTSKVTIVVDLYKQRMDRAIFAIKTSYDISYQSSSGSKARHKAPGDQRLACLLSPV